MKEMNDNELDQLILETLNRKEMLSGISTQVMLTVRRQHRRAAFRRWSRIIAFSFGLPLVVMLMVGAAYFTASLPGLGAAGTPIVVAMCVFTLIILIQAGMWIRWFKLDEY
ncbi:MAG: cysteine protease [Prevotella sp.]|nr:cysteine protease [Prevotella sp.]